MPSVWEHRKKLSWVWDRINPITFGILTGCRALRLGLKLQSLRGT